MIANIVIVALIAAYCIYLIYKGYKNYKEGKPVGCAGCSGNCSSCSGCSGKTAPKKKDGSSTGSMFYAFGAFLIIYLGGVSIYQLVLWIKKWRERRKDEE